MNDIGSRIESLPVDKKAIALLHLSPRLRAARQTERLAVLLTNPTFLEVSVPLGLVHHLAAELTAALDIVPTHHQQHAILRQLRFAIEQHKNFIAEYPTSFFQCIWNACWFRNDLVATSADPATQPSSSDNHHTIRRLLQSWRAIKQKTDPEFSWLRSLRPPVPSAAERGVIELRGHEGPIEKVLFSPDGTLLVSIASGESGPRIWDPCTGAQLAYLFNEDVIYDDPAVDLSPDGSQLVVTHDGGFIIWDLPTFRCRAVVARPRSAHTEAEFDKWQLLAVAFNSTDNQIITASYDGGVRIWDADTLSEIGCFHGARRPIRILAVSPNGKYIAYAPDGKTVRVCDAKGRKQVAKLRHKSEVCEIVFSRNSDRMYVTTLYGLTLWQTNKWKILDADALSEHDIERIALSHDDRCIAGSIDNGTLIVFTAQAEEPARYQVHDDRITTIAFSPDDSLIAAGSDDGSIRLLRRTEEPTPIKVHHDDGVADMVFSPDGKLLATAGDATIRVWNTTTGRLHSELQTDDIGIECLAYATDGSFLVSGSYLGNVYIWHANSPSQPLVGRDGVGKHTVNVIAIIPGNRRIVSGSKDGTLRIWDSTTASQISSLIGHKAPVTAVAVSHDGRLIASASQDKRVRIWDSRTGRSLLILKGHTKPALSVRFAPNRDQVVSGSDDGTARVWDLQSGRQILQLGPDFDLKEAHSSTSILTDEVAFSLDGRRILAGSYGDGFSVFAADTGQCLDQIDGYGDIDALANPHFRWRLLVRPPITELESVTSSEIVARLPVPFDTIRTHPNGALWAASYYNNVYMFALENS